MDTWRYVAAVEDVDKAATDTALAAVSGSFENLFSQRCIREEDPPDMDPPRSWSTNIFVVDRPQRREIKRAIQTMQTLVYEEVEDARNKSRYPQPDELFLAKYGWRFQPVWNEDTQEYSHTYVHATGLFKSGPISNPQSVGSDWALIDQWDVEQDMINTIRSGDGNRIEVVYAGRYFIDARGNFDRAKELDFQWIKNTVPFGAIYHFPDGTTTGEIVEEIDLVAGDKIGILVKSDELGQTLNLLQGSWMGLRRIH